MVQEQSEVRKLGREVEALKKELNRLKSKVDSRGLDGLDNAQKKKMKELWESEEDEVWENA